MVHARWKSSRKCVMLAASGIGSDKGSLIREGEITSRDCGWLVCGREDFLFYNRAIFDYKIPTESRARDSSYDGLLSDYRYRVFP